MIKKITVKGEFSNRTYLYEVEDGIDFFDAVRKASAEFVNTPDGRKIYYKKGSFSWLDFSLLFVAAGAGDQFGGLHEDGRIYCRRPPRSCIWKSSVYRCLGVQEVDFFRYCQSEHLPYGSDRME